MKADSIMAFIVSGLSFLGWGALLVYFALAEDLSVGFAMLAGAGVMILTIAGVIFLAKLVKRE